MKKIHEVLGNEEFNMKKIKSFNLRRIKNTHLYLRFQNAQLQATKKLIFHYHWISRKNLQGKNKGFPFHSNDLKKGKLLLKKLP